MKTWTRAAVLTKCGGPCQGGDGYIPPGGPMLLLRLTEISTTKIRCVQCAGEKPPADLPYAEERIAFSPMPRAADLSPTIMEPIERPAPDPRDTAKRAKARRKKTVRRR